MIICTINKYGICNRHNVKHIGRLAQLAVEESERGEKYRRKWDELYGNSLQAKRLIRSLPLAKQCQYFGERLTADEVKANQLAGCRSCNNTINVFHCKYLGQKKFNDGPYTRGAECMSCKDWVHGQQGQNPTSHENRAGGAGISWPGNIRFDHTNLFPGEVPGMRFNCSIIESGDGFIFAFRNGWAGSRLYLCRLTSDFKPVEKSWAKLQLPAGGQEDPRLFRLNGVLHLWYICYFRNKTSVRFCRINEETLTVEDEFFPQIPHRQPWEKNHSYFDYQGIAHAVYTVSPHKIIRVEGNNCQHAYNTPYPGSWSGGAMRGGASPVLHNGEYYHFFHGAYDSVKGRRRYCTGVYTFRSEPPFDVLRFTPHPIDQADLERQHDNWCDVLFIGGSLYRNGMWVTANGIHDRYAEIRQYPSDWVESQLVKHE